MKTYLSIGDLIDFYYKIHTIGINKIIARFTGSNKSRVKKAWDSTVNLSQTNWWSIPLIRKRWNILITGDAGTEYTEYLFKKYLKDKDDICVLSPGCGTGNKELKFADYKNIKSIEAFDISPKRIESAKENAAKYGGKKIIYFIADVYDFDFGSEKYDVIVFDSFLHHVKDIDSILEKVHLSLTPGGILVINEYVGPNRFQWRKEQLSLANKALLSLPSSKRKRIQAGSKNKIYRPGLIRMILSDPSEAVNSETILPAIKKRFNTLEEKPYGGNILQLALKDIAHNFIGESDENTKLLNSLIEIEDDYLEKVNESDFVFGIYSK